MKNILYVGNALSHKGKTKTSVETLGSFLCEDFNVKIASKKSNRILRLLDMVALIFGNFRQADYVLIDTYSTSNFYFAFIISQLCNLLNIKYVTILRGGNLERRLIDNPKFCRMIFSSAHKLVAPSLFLKNTFNKYGYIDVQFIPNSIEIENYEFIERSIDSIKLLWVRSFAGIYNPGLAILVLEKLLSLGYEATLTMIGPDVDGSLIKVKELANKKNLNVEFTGKLTKPEWIEKSKNYNIFINTTNFDNTPVSVIEAMALGLPIVSTNVGGMPFLIENEVDGLLVKPNSVDHMVESLIRLKNDENLKRQLVSHARSKVEMFSWSEVKPKWQALLS